MSTPTPSLRIGIFGPDRKSGEDRHGCPLWAAGYSALISAAGATPVLLTEAAGSRAWERTLDGLDGVIVAPGEMPTPKQSMDSETLIRWCEDHELPLLAIDSGMHILNGIYHGTLYTDLPRELPEALQHRHPPERGLRHAIEVVDGTHMCNIYGEGEVIVNSEHRKAVQKIGRGFRVGARALDGVVEAIEADNDRWFCVGVQWQPASATASGLDIQLFRGLIEAGQKRAEEALEEVCAAA